MKARFIGDPRDNFSGPDVFPLRGVVFLKNQWTSVADEALFAKLQTHNHFETSDTGVPFVETAAARVAVPLIDRMSPDDMIVGEPAPDVLTPTADPAAADERAGLIAQLEAIPGAEFDGRWGVPKLRQALEAARFMAGDDE